MTQASSRREFLRRASAVSGFGAMGMAAPWALNMAAAGSAAAQTASDYKALVCVFLYGGNDNHNTVVPYDDVSHAQYAAIRTTIALPKADLSATVITPDNPWTDNRQMALHPALAPLKTLFDGGQLAVAMNMGTLIREGATLADYKAGLGLPPKLFSHNDQQSIWQSSLAEGSTNGWGGRMADVFAAGNGADAVYTSISAAGNAVMMAGNSVVQYQVSGGGSIAVNRVFGSDASTETMKRLLQRSSTHLFEEGHAGVARRSIAADARLRGVLAGTRSFTFPAGGLAAQLQIVARMIAAREALGIKRQVFFVSQGGFDNHDNLIDLHPGLLGSVGSAMKAFYDATAELGVQNQVTTFTGADFGRTLANNGDGSDHGWGSYHFVMGGAVKPRTWVGRVPAVTVVEGPDNVGGGRLLPAIGVDQYGATLAKWFGVSDTQLDTVFPNLKNYSTKNLGFMQA
jgi:uncharacterized protein (DUF1501 family)